MPKNIVLCCDGTANEFVGHPTNVLRLFATLDHDPARQIAYYHPGLGTMEAAGALTRAARWTTKLLGKAFGYGLERDVRDAYVFLMRHYEDGDTVFLFGFSRGAYTVRVLAALLRAVGLMHAGNEPLVPYAIRLLKSRWDPSAEDQAGAESGKVWFARTGEFKNTFSHRDCRPHFVGVWDTVNSVGWFANPLRVPYTTSNGHIAVARHAVAIDERRAFFQPLLWPNAPTGSRERIGDLKEVWFPGVHSDVGGGYPDKENGLAKVSLAWMLREAASAGLRIDPAKMDRQLGVAPSPFSPPDVQGVLHESLTAGWWPAQFIPKRVSRRVPDGSKSTWRREWRLAPFSRRAFPKGEAVLIHESAYLRGAEYARRLPQADVERVS